jgi:hypothetical protein
MAGSKRIAMAFLLGALVVGGMLGFASARVIDGGSIASEERVSIRDRLGSELELTPVQRAQLDTILDRRHNDMTEAFAPVRPSLDSIRDRARDEIRRMLNEEQRPKFEQYLMDQKRGDEPHRERKSQ